MKLAGFIFCILIIPYMSHCRLRRKSERSQSTESSEGLGNDLRAHYRNAEQETSLTGIFDSTNDPNLMSYILYPGPWSEKNEVIVEYNNTASLKDAPFHANSKFVFLVHGFIQNWKSQFPRNVKKAYDMRMEKNKEEHWNVIIVDWGALSGNARDETPSYIRAVKNIPLCARRLADFIKYMMNNGVIKSLDEVHLIGLSLGAHFVGQTGEFLKNENLPGGEVGRVTGLDPALPLFAGLLTNSTRRLTKTDGKFVDIYHTGGGVFGLARPMGDVDFYPNGGTWWHGWTEECSDWSKFTWNHGGPAFCSHNLAPRLYALSILEDNIKACKCTSYWIYKIGLCSCRVNAIFGEFTDTEKNKDGSYYLDLDLPDNFLED